MKSIKELKEEKIIFTAWYCPLGPMGHFVCYKATNKDINKHLEECVKNKISQSIKKRDGEWKKEITKWAKKQKTFRLYDNKLRKGFNSQYPVVFFNDLMSVLNTISKQDKPI